MIGDVPPGVTPSPIEAALPAGHTCAACEWFVRCAWLIGRDASETACDWKPSRFRLAVVEGGLSP